MVRMRAGADYPPVRMPRKDTSGARREIPVHRCTSSSVALSSINCSAALRLPRLQWHCNERATTRSYQYGRNSSAPISVVARCGRGASASKSSMTRSAQPQNPRRLPDLPQSRYGNRFQDRPTGDWPSPDVLLQTRQPCRSPLTARATTCAYKKRLPPGHSGSACQLHSGGHGRVQRNGSVRSRFDPTPVEAKSPDFHFLRRRSHHLAAGLALERARERGHV